MRWGLTTSIIRLHYTLGFVVFLALSCDDVPDLFEPPVPQTEIDIGGAWSPDGTKIIYFRNPSEEAKSKWPWGVFLHDVGSGKDTLLFPNFEAVDFSWSPDGNRIAFTKLNDAQIHIMKLNGDSVGEVTSEERNFRSSWSPCGNYLAYEKTFGPKRGVWIYDFDRKTHEKLVPYGELPDWNAGCGSLNFIDYDSTDWGQVAVFSFQDGIVRDLQYFQKYKRSLSVSPGGEKMVIGANVNLWILHSDGSGLRQLTTKGGDYADWSPDGQWIVYTYLSKDNGHLWLIRPDGTDDHQITF